MSIEANKQMVTSTWEAFVKGDIKTAFANMSDEVSWLIPDRRVIEIVRGYCKGESVWRIGG